MNAPLPHADLDWAHIGTIDDIPPQGSRRVMNAGRKIAVFRTVDDRIHALEDRCPHKHGPLSEGIVHDGCVTCPLHNWVISLETGAAQGADDGRTTVFSVRLDGRDIFINLNTGA